MDNTSNKSATTDSQETLGEADKYLWTRGNMPHIYATADEVLAPTQDRVVIGLPLTWETLCVIDAIRHQVPNLTVIPCSSGENSSLQPGVFKYLEEWGVAHVKTASEADRVAVLKQEPDVIIDCTFALGEAGLRNGVLGEDVIIMEDTKTGENVIVDHGLRNPYIILDHSQLKREYENQEGIGYSVIAALMSMGLYLPRYKVGIVGYGYVGTGLAKYAAAAGAQVYVYDVDPARQEKAAELHTALAKQALLETVDIVITATGRKDALVRDDIANLDKQLFLANAGGDDEWNRNVLFDGVTQQHIHEHITQATIGQCTVREICGGNSVNLAVGVSVSEFLDITFAHLITALAQLHTVDLQPGRNELDLFDVRVLKARLQAVSWLQHVAQPDL